MTEKTNVNMVQVGVVLIMKELVLILICFPDQAFEQQKISQPWGNLNGLLIRFWILGACSPVSMYMEYIYQSVEGTPPETSDFIPSGGKVVQPVNPFGYNENGVPQYDEETWHSAKIDENFIRDENKKRRKSL